MEMNPPSQNPSHSVVQRAPSQTTSPRTARTAIPRGKTLAAILMTAVKQTSKTISREPRKTFLDQTTEKSKGRMSTAALDLPVLSLATLARTQCASEACPSRLIL